MAQVGRRLSKRGPLFVEFVRGHRGAASVVQFLRRAVARGGQMHGERSPGKPVAFDPAASERAAWFDAGAVMHGTLDRDGGHWILPAGDAVAWRTNQL